MNMNTLNKLDAISPMIRKRIHQDEKYCRTHWAGNTQYCHNHAQYHAGIIMGLRYAGLITGNEGLELMDYIFDWFNHIGAMSK